MGSLASSDADAAGDETGSESSDSEWDDDTTPWLPGLSKNAPPERVFQAFRYQSTCHAVACEAPALVIESLVRALAYGMGSIALLVLACFGAHAAARRKRAAVYIREAIIFATSLPSFVVPGILPLSVYVAVVGHIAAVRAWCTPYRACAYLIVCPLHRYKDLDSSGQDWDLQPLWTLIGDVDPRRFVIVRRGVGSFAENCSTIAYQPSGMPWSLARVCSHGLSHGLEC